MQDHIGPIQQGPRPQGQQVGITGPRADKGDMPGAECFLQIPCEQIA